jgi:hypothetical protein
MVHNTGMWRIYGEKNYDSVNMVENIQFDPRLYFVDNTLMLQTISGNIDHITCEEERCYGDYEGEIVIELRDEEKLYFSTSAIEEVCVNGRCDGELEDIVEGSGHFTFILFHPLEHYNDAKVYIHINR